MSPDQKPNTLDPQILAHLSAYLDQPEEKRAAWLQQNCGDNPRLMKAMLHMTDAAAACGDFLESSPTATMIPDRSGKRIGRYELISELGRGGMGAVYRARRADGAFEQEVAIKLFLQDLVSDSALQRFNAERQILASLEDPGIARLIDGGTTADGTPFVVMELIEGESITKFCDHQSLDLQARLKLFQSVCQTLDVAHEKGIVHRDIKPANVLATKEGRTVLVDFGIAKVLRANEFAAALPATVPGLTALTPDYASPEQIRGQEIGIASDIYSLGILLYEILTGSRPYTTVSLSPGEIERSVCETIPPDPSSRVATMRARPPAGLDDNRRLRSKLRGDLDRIVMTALRKQPEQRYKSAASFAADIGRYLSGMPVKARGASSLYRASKFVARHRFVVAATVFAFIALLGGLVAVSLQAREAQRQRDLAMQEASRAKSAKDFLVEMIGRADPYENSESATLIGAIKQSIAGIDSRFKGQPLLEADMRYAIGYALQNLGEVEPAREQMEKALALRMQHGSRLDIAEATAGLGIIDWWKSDFQAGEKHFRDALDLIDVDVSPRATVLRVDALTNFAGMMIDAGDYTRSETISRKAIAAAENWPDAPAATLATLWGNLATAQEGNKKFDVAATSFEKTLEMQRKATGEMNPAYAIVLNNQAHLFADTGKLDKAIENLKQSLKIRRQTLGKNHPQTATALFNLAHVQTRAGDFVAAERNGLEALKIAEDSYKPGHPRIGKAHQALADLYLKTNQLGLARKHALYAQTIYKKADGVDPSWIEAANALLEKIDNKESAP
ncbi:MAG TPA: serine/threonine-protein kinase [Dokdonella sp.]|uniref:serine/threonine-protein kinase n=1 Tax=Dokdonella sp. TaxID=2291710 RepID=UPI002D800300|nr:serine/threonine-protein kinase [Dokdonella sp.]HET9031976.1 serine/threonine-protein kinase [Dokdonella sp.]